MIIEKIVIIIKSIFSPPKANKVPLLRSGERYKPVEMPDGYFERVRQEASKVKQTDPLFDLLNEINQSLKEVKEKPNDLPKQISVKEFQKNPDYYGKFYKIVMPKLVAEGNWFEAEAYYELV